MDHSSGQSRDTCLLLDVLFERHGYDFRNYAYASIERRTQNFLAGTVFQSVAELTRQVARDPALAAALVQHYSINVTEMFRDPFVYLALRRKVIPVLRTWPHIRVWCAGCASGEEVYSLAIVFKEEGLLDRTTLYATDFNDACLASAKSGVFPLDGMQEATRNYQQSGGTSSFSEYYHAAYEAATLVPWLKTSVTFANHNLVSDSSFGEMHLVLCRNVMIYFNKTLQNRALRLFYDSIPRGGFLCLGTMEDLAFTDSAEDFTVVDKRARIFKKAVMERT